MKPTSNHKMVTKTLTEDELSLVTGGESEQYGTNGGGSGGEDSPWHEGNKLRKKCADCGVDDTRSELTWYPDKQCYRCAICKLRYIFR